MFMAIASGAVPGAAAVRADVIVEYMATDEKAGTPTVNVISAPYMNGHVPYSMPYGGEEEPS